MPRSVPQAYRDAAYPSRTGETFAHTCIIEHDDLPEDIRITDLKGKWDDQLQSWVTHIDGHDYFQAPFVLEFPGESDDESRGKITIPNVDQRIGEAVRLMSGPALVTIRVVLRSIPDLIISELTKLELRDIDADEVAVSGSLRWGSIDDEPWPQEIISGLEFPAVNHMF